MLVDSSCERLKAVIDAVGWWRAEAHVRSVLLECGGFVPSNNSLSLNSLRCISVSARLIGPSAYARLLEVKSPVFVLVHGPKYSRKNLGNTGHLLLQLPGDCNATILPY